jgi:hypothetical protein
MDFDKLLEPYSENGRTIKGQVAWLIKKGIPSHAIDYAMASVYKEIEVGRTFSDGNELDQELLRVAREHHEQELQEQMVKRLASAQEALDTEWNKLTKWQKLKDVMVGRA